MATLCVCVSASGVLVVFWGGGDYARTGTLTWRLDELLVDSQEGRLRLLTAFVQSDHLQERGRNKVNSGKHFRRQISFLKTPTMNRWGRGKGRPRSIHLMSE